MCEKLWNQEWTGQAHFIFLKKERKMFSIRSKLRVSSAVTN